MEAKDNVKIMNYIKSIPGPVGGGTYLSSQPWGDWAGTCLLSFKQASCKPALHSEPVSKECPTLGANLL